MKYKSAFILVLSILLSCNTSYKTGKLKINISKELQIKDFQFVFDSKINSFRVKTNTIDVTLSQNSFLQAGYGQENVEESRGSFFIKDKIKKYYNHQTIDSVSITTDTLKILGYLEDKNSKIPYQLILIVDNQNIDFEIIADTNHINRLWITIPTDKNEYYYGLGEQFTYLCLNGHKFQSFVSEQGIGRGKQPLTTLVNIVAKSGGTPYTTYAAMPFFFSTKKYSIFLKNSQYSTFDFRNSKELQINCFSSRVSGILKTGSIKQLIIQNAQQNGLMRPLPDWAHKGAIVGIQGGTQKVATIYDSLKKYHTPISALWLQDWVGPRFTSFGKQLWWNWQLDTAHYPNWPQISDAIVRDSVALMVYLNPFLVDASTNPKHKVNLFEIAKQKDFLVKRPNGQIYLIPNTDFSAAMLDLTNPHAVEWFKDIVKKYVLNHNVKGWMADFGEALPYDAVLFSQQKASEYHNIYPVQWAKLNRQIIDSLAKGNEFVFFCRAGFSHSSRYATLFWEGDQLVSWDKYDGIKSAVVGLLSSGLSGIPLNHSDIGGYTAIANPLAKNIRSRELLWRWIELNAFGVVFRTHEGNLPDQNYQIYNDTNTIKHFAKYANIFATLFEYRKQLIIEATSTGMPIVRPMFLVFEDDPECYKIEYQQFMFGNDFLVAPVLDKGKTNKKVYLPKGLWINLWNAQKIESSGQYITVDAPLGKIPVFYKDNNPLTSTIAQKIREIK